MLDCISPSRTFKRSGSVGGDPASPWLMPGDIGTRGLSRNVLHDVFDDVPDSGLYPIYLCIGSYLPLLDLYFRHKISKFFF